MYSNMSAGNVIVIVNYIYMTVGLTSEHTLKQADLGFVYPKCLEI